VLIETGSTETSGGDDQEKTDQDLEKLFKLFEVAEDCIIDGVVAQDMK